MDHPLNQSKKLERFAQSYQSFMGSLPEGVGSDPFQELFSRSREPYPNQRIYEEAVAQGDAPLQAELESWLYWLLESRLMLVAEVREAELLYRQPYRLAALGNEPQKFAQLQAGVLRGSQRQREQMLQGLFQASDELAEFRSAKATRLREFFERLSLSGDEAYASPLPIGKVNDLAKNFLEQTDGLAQDWVRPGFLEFQQSRQAFSTEGRAGAEEGWPARLKKDVLIELLGKPKELKELRLKALVLPARVAPISFLQSFQLLGRELCREFSARNEPFIRRFDPYENKLDHWGYFLALSVSSDVFGRRRLGLGASASREFQGALACSWLLELRRLAVDVLLKRSLQSSDSEYSEAAQHLSASLYQQEYAPDFCLAHRRVSRRAEAEFVQLLSAPVRTEEFRNTFDEDYFEQPRAWEALRSELVTTQEMLPAKSAREEQELKAKKGQALWLQIFSEARES